MGIILTNETFSGRDEASGFEEENNYIDIPTG